MVFSIAVELGTSNPTLVADCYTIIEVESKVIAAGYSISYHRNQNH